MKPDTTFKLGKTSLTKEEHDEVMKTRRRPITQQPIQRRQHRDDTGDTDGSLVDRYVNEALKEQQ